MKLSVKVPALALISAAYFVGSGCSGRWPDATSANNNLKRSVQAKFLNEESFSGIHVSADAAHNQVVLSGSVPTPQTGDEAVSLAKSIDATPVVIDNLNVPAADDQHPVAEEARMRAKALGEKIGESLGDAWVYTRVEAKLVQQESAPSLRIDVNVRRDVVTLRGEVKTIAMKEQAERIARGTEGVRGVRNLLHVRA